MPSLRHDPVLSAAWPRRARTLLALVALSITPLTAAADDTALLTAAADDTALPEASIEQGVRALAPSLEKALDEAFAESGLPGLTVGLWVPGQGSWVATRGLANLETRRPMTADLQAPIGSITKSFAATIALELVGEGTLRLEDTIDRWYPQVPDASAITVEMLLNHSSGFADISQLQLDVLCRDPTRRVSPDELIAIGTALPRASFPPGKGFEYSSVNTIILGRVMEKTTGRAFDVLLRDRCSSRSGSTGRSSTLTGGSIRPSATATPISAPISRALPIRPRGP